MFNFFRKKNGTPKPPPGPQMVDIDGIPIGLGDFVQSLRYEMGVCKIIDGEHGFDYESIESGQRVSFLKMVDAATSYQKVRKVEQSQG